MCALGGRIDLSPGSSREIGASAEKEDFDMMMLMLSNLMTKMMLVLNLMISMMLLLDLLMLLLLDDQHDAGFELDNVDATFKFCEQDVKMLGVKIKAPSIDSMLAVSLFTNSIIRQDPKHCSDAEMRSHVQPRVGGVYESDVWSACLKMPQPNAAKSAFLDSLAAWLALWLFEVIFLR